MTIRKILSQSLTKKLFNRFEGIQKACGNKLFKITVILGYLQLIFKYQPGAHLHIKIQLTLLRAEIMQLKLNNNYAIFLNSIYMYTYNSPSQ